MIGPVGRGAARVLDGCARVLGRAGAVVASLAEVVEPGAGRRRGGDQGSGAGATTRAAGEDIGERVTAIARRLRHAADVEGLVRAPVRQVIAVLGDLGPEELGLLHERESAHRARAGVLDAIERELLRRV